MTVQSRYSAWIAGGPIGPTFQWCGHDRAVLLYEQNAALKEQMGRAAIAYAHWRMTDGAHIGFHQQAWSAFQLTDTYRTMMGEGK